MLNNIAVNIEQYGQHNTVQSSFYQTRTSDNFSFLVAATGFHTKVSVSCELTNLFCVANYDFGLEVLGPKKA